MKKIFIIIFSLLLLAIGALAGFFYASIKENTVLQAKLNTIHPIREHNDLYKFIDPLLAYIIPQSDQAQLNSLKNKISDYIDSQTKSQKLSNASVFFYDLNRGRWIGINEMDKYNPASMLKVVIMVSYLKESEKNPDILKESLVYTNEIDSFVKGDSFNSPSDLKAGRSYNVEYLINKMITDSDNGAQFLLLSNINQSSLDYIYNVLNIQAPDATKNNFVISPRTYSLFFRILYSATYLNDTDSEKALDILSKTSFSDGLVAGLPKDVVVSHKFGEHVISQNNNVQEVELHDCGIIYYPENPYLLCVMTKGENVDNLKMVIKGISDLIYQNYSTMK